MRVVYANLLSHSLNFVILHLAHSRTLHSFKLEKVVGLVKNLAGWHIANTTQAIISRARILDFLFSLELRWLLFFGVLRVGRLF